MFSAARPPRRFPLCWVSKAARCFFGFAIIPGRFYIGSIHRDGTIGIGDSTRNGIRSSQGGRGGQGAQMPENTLWLPEENPLSPQRGKIPRPKKRGYPRRNHGVAIWHGLCTSPLPERARRIGREGW